MFSIRSAFQTYRKKVMAAYGSDGKRGGQPSWEAHVRTPAGNAELRAFAERVQARYKAEVSAQPAHLLRGAPSLVGLPDTPACTMTLPDACAVGFATAGCLRGCDGEDVSKCAATQGAGKPGGTVFPRMLVYLSPIIAYRCGFTL